MCPRRAAHPQSVPCRHLAPAAVGRWCTAGGRSRHSPPRCPPTTTAPCRSGAPTPARPPRSWRRTAAPNTRKRMRRTGAQPSAPAQSPRSTCTRRPATHTSHGCCTHTGGHRPAPSTRPRTRYNGGRPSSPSSSVGRRTAPWPRRTRPGAGGGGWH